MYTAQAGSAMLIASVSSRAMISRLSTVILTPTYFISMNNTSLKSSLSFSLTSIDVTIKWGVASLQLPEKYSNGNSHNYGI